MLGTSPLLLTTLPRTACPELLIIMQRAPYDCVIVGASGGIGHALAERLRDTPEVTRIFATARSPETLKRRSHAKDDAFIPVALDLESEASIAACAASLRAADAAPRLVIVASGLLHAGDAVQPEKTLSALTTEAMMRSFAVNSIGPALVAKHFFPLMPRRGRTMFAAISARVGSISDNRLGGWYSYRASKAALNMLLRTLSVELRRRNREALCIGLHPGTVATALSAPFQSGVPEGKLFTPDYSARRLLAVMQDLQPEDSGQLFAWDGQVIPF